MAKRTGAETEIAVEVGTTFATAEAVTAGDKALVNSFSDSKNASVLRENPIGGGAVMDGTDTQQGAVSPSVNINADLRFNDANNQLLAQMFGGASIATWTDGAYCHSITLCEKANEFWNTIAVAPTTSEVKEFPSCATRGVTVSSAGFPGPVQAAFDVLANRRLITGTTNSSAAVSACTVANTRRVIADQSDLFVVNAQAGGAVSSGDKVEITSFSISYQRAQEHVAEMKGSAGNSEPTLTGDPPFKATVTVTLKTLEDFTYFTAADAGTAYKAEIQITDSTAIGGSQYYHYKFCFPYLKILQDPSHDISSAADNSHTITFEALTAASAPTGMLDVYPYVLILSDLDAAILA